MRLIRSHKNFLFALGMQEGPDEYRDKVWWSHPAELTASRSRGDLRQSNPTASLDG